MMLGLRSLLLAKSTEYNSHKVLDEYLAVPLVAKNTKLADCTFLVLDFETTGINHKNDNLVSMGWVEIENLTIRLGRSRHIIINPKDKLTSGSILIHKLTDDELKYGCSISTAMDILLKHMQHKVLVVHFRMIEENFINEICNRLYALKRLPMHIIDTLELELNKYPTFSAPETSESFRLYNLREKYNLPRYKAHNATVDALATAELFLAQLSWSTAEKNLTLGELL